MDQYKDMAQQAMQGQGGAPGMDDAAELMQMQERYNKLAQSGIERKGKILSASETGRADVGGSPEYEFKVEITPDGASPTRGRSSSSCTRRTSSTSRRARS